MSPAMSDLGSEYAWVLLVGYYVTDGSRVSMGPQRLSAKRGPSEAQDGNRSGKPYRVPVWKDTQRCE